MPSVSSFIYAVSALAAAVSAHPIAHAHGDHHHVEAGSLPGRWFHDDGHPSHSLFRRQAVETLPAVGSPEWTAKYPTPGAPLKLNEQDLPAAWVAAYKAAVANGLIPAIPPTVVVTDADYNSTPTYPEGFDASSPEVCSGSVQCYNATDVVNLPDGTAAISFDDGPAPGSQLLYDWLGANHVRSTHFLIGGNIVKNPKLFLQAFRLNQELAVHTYTHPHMTSQSDLGVLAELGWTMQVIHDSTGGRVPRFWRPAYGDVDQRVRGIAEHVFGMRAVMWNKDTNDWALPETQTAAHLAADMETWLAGPKTPGLNILQHELSDDTVNVFINTTYAGLLKHGWRTGSIGQLAGVNGAAYANAKDNLGAVEPVTGIETAGVSTGTGTLPVWYTGTASTTKIGETPVPSPPAPEAPSAPATDSSSAPATDSSSAPATESTSAPAVPSTPAPAPAPAPAPGTTTTTRGPPQGPPLSSAPVPTTTRAPVVLPAQGGGGGVGGNPASRSTASSSAPAASQSGTTPPDAAALTRPSLALTALAAVLAIAMFA